MMGLLDARPGEGTSVAQRPADFPLHLFIRSDPITGDNDRELGEARRLVDGDATQRGSEGEKALIRHLAEQTLRSYDTAEEYLHADWLSHQAISEATHSSRLLQTILLSRRVILAERT